MKLSSMVLNYDRSLSAVGKMKIVKLWIVIVVFSNFLMSCSTTLYPTAAPISAEQNIITVAPTRLPPTSTISSSDTPLPSATNTPFQPHPPPTSSPLPSNTPTPNATNLPLLLASPVLSKTPTAVQETPVWSPEIEVLEIIPSEQIAWSPRANELLYETCPPNPYDQLSVGSIIQVNLADDPGHLTIAKDFICSAFGISVTWAPDGQRVLFTGLSREEVDGLDYIPETADIWLIEPGSEARVVLSRDKVSTRWTPGLSWIDDNTIFYSGYGGGGHSSSALLNLQENTRSELIVLHICGISGFSADYLVGCMGASTTSNITALAIPLRELRQNELELSDEAIPFDDFFLNRPGPIYLYLSYDHGALHEPQEFIFNSSFMDWLPDTNQMLVLTWDRGLDLELDAPVETNLQIWNVADGSLNLIVQGGKYGRFSPDGRYLAYVSGGDDLFQLHLLDMVTGSVLFSQPEWINSESWDVVAYFSFSPDGRYFTSIAPGAETDEQGTLTVYDLSNHHTVLTLPGQQMRPVWSPDNAQFAYKNQYGGLTIYNLMTNSTISITDNNDSRISSPRWSYDGRYLSVRVSPDSTVILKMP